MANRLTRIYTRTGDRGTTGLGNGKRVDKSSLRIEAIGNIDETNCTLGMILAGQIDDDIRDILVDIQHALFDAGAELSMPGETFIAEKYVIALEHAIDRLNGELNPLKEFILPGGSVGSSVCHLARAVCRRAERSLIRLSQEETVNEFTIKMLNRMSDLLFVMARTIAGRDNKPEINWNKEQWQDK